MAELNPRGNLTDVRFAALRFLGHTGTVSDMLLQWLLDNGATTPSVPDAWKEFLLLNLDPGEGLRFIFNGTLGTTSAQSNYRITPGTEGAISCRFVTLNTIANQDIMGDNSWIRIRSDPNSDIRAQLLGNAGNFAQLNVAIGVEHEVGMQWALGGADGKIGLDGFSNTKPQDAVAAITDFYIGRASATNAFFNGAIWDVRIYSDELAQNVIHHWPMDEGVGETFLDAVGGDHILFSADIGSWGVVATVANPFTYHRNDYWFDYMAQEGHTQESMNERELSFWLSFLPPIPTGGGFSSGFSTGFRIS